MLPQRYGSLPVRVCSEDPHGPPSLHFLTGTPGTVTLSHADSGSLQQNHLIHTGKWGNVETCVVLMVLASKGKLRTPG